MSENTKIEWATHSASPWYGCTKVSPGCARCYAEGWAKRGGKDIWGKGHPRQKSKSFEANCRKWNRAAGDWLWKCPSRGMLFVKDSDADTHCFDCDARLVPNRPTVFPSLCDWLDSEVDPVWLADALRVMRECQNLTFLLLTKRPENFFNRCAAALNVLSAKPETLDVASWLSWWLDGTQTVVPENIHIGTSIENGDYVWRAAELKKIPAVKRFISFEPLLGSIQNIDLTGIDGAIIGGESGPGYRPMKILWVESLVEQCDAAGVNVFVKQDCGPRPGMQGRLPAKLWARKEMP